MEKKGSFKYHTHEHTMQWWRALGIRAAQFGGGAQFSIAILEIGQNPKGIPSLGSLGQRFTTFPEARITVGQ